MQKPPQAYLQQGAMNTVVSHAVGGRVWEPPQQGQHRVRNLIGHNEGNERPAGHFAAAVHGGVPTPGKGERLGICHPAIHWAA